MEIERARSELRKLRYRDGHMVNASDVACSSALVAAGNVAQLEATMPALIERMNANPGWRPKTARAFPKWIARVVSTELTENNGQLKPQPEPARETPELRRFKEPKKRSENAKPRPIDV